jgi:hypothetical protein
MDFFELFRVYNAGTRKFFSFSLAHLTSVLLDEEQPERHSATGDAKLSIRLFMRYKDDLDQVKWLMLGTRAPISFAKKNNYQYQGICLAGFNTKACICKTETGQ